MLLLPRSWLDANESCIQTRSFGKGEIFNTAWFLIVSFAKTCHCIISYCFIWEAISKTRASCFIRGSKLLETIKALGLRPRAFITLSVFGTPDETLALVFDILHEWFARRLVLRQRQKPARKWPVWSHDELVLLLAVNWWLKMGMWQLPGWSV